MNKTIAQRLPLGFRYPHRRRPSTLDCFLCPDSIWISRYLNGMVNEPR